MRLTNHLVKDGKKPFGADETAQFIIRFDRNEKRIVVSHTSVGTGKGRKKLFVKEARVEAEVKTKESG